MSSQPLASSEQSAAATTTERSLLDQIVEKVSRDPESRERGRDLVKNFVAQFLDGNMTLSPDSEAMINRADRADRSSDLAATERGDA